MIITAKDRSVLRELANKQLELASSPYMKELKKLWLLNNSCNGLRPMITIETGTFASEIIPSMQKCEGEVARSIEFEMLSKLVNVTHFKDDTILEPFFGVKNRIYLKPFDIDIHIDKSSDKDSIGHHFVEEIKNLEEDFGKLKESTIHFDNASQQEYLSFVDSIFGDILPIKMVGSCLYSCLTQDIVHIMSMENMMFSMYDCPSLFKQMMQKLTNDYIKFYRYLERKNLISSTQKGEFLAQGSYAFTNELPDDLAHYNSTDVWGFMDSQETVGISPEMFNEFIFPYYYQISKEYGLLSYGCCEPVHCYWDASLAHFKNLRKISISPWCNEEFMGEKLANTNIVYHRKPSANFIGVNAILDEEEVRKAFKKTIKAAKGCSIEITQRDVYTVHKNIDKVKNYVNIIREETEKAY